jgi:hypothetical protein
MTKKTELLDQRSTNLKAYAKFRDHCLRSKLSKHWVSTDDNNPEFGGMFFIKHKDFLGDVDITEYYINKKGKGYWLCAGTPTHWAEIETYEYKWPDGTLVYDDEFI